MLVDEVRVYAFDDGDFGLVRTVQFSGAGVCLSALNHNLVYGFVGKKSAGFYSLDLGPGSPPSRSVGGSGASGASGVDGEDEAADTDGGVTVATASPMLLLESADYGEPIDALMLMESDVPYYLLCFAKRGVVVDESGRQGSHPSMERIVWTAPPLYFGTIGPLLLQVWRVVSVCVCVLICQSTHI